MNYDNIVCPFFVQPFAPSPLLTYFRGLCTILIKKLLPQQYLTLLAFSYDSVGSPCPITDWNQCQSTTLDTCGHQCFWSSRHCCCICIYTNFCKFVHIGFIVFIYLRQMPEQLLDAEPHVHAFL